MKRAFSMAVALLGWAWAPGATRAHDTWLLVSDYGPAPDAAVTVRVCNGHAFPRSDLRIAADLLHRLWWKGPGGEPQPLTPEADGAEFKAPARAAGAGVHVAGLDLKRPRMPEPVAWARALVIAGDQDDPAAYRTHVGLEVVPERALTEVGPGGELPLAAYWNGARIETRLVVTPEKGRTVTLSTTPARPALYTVPTAGLYLATVSHRGRSASLTFSVRPARTGDVP